MKNNSPFRTKGLFVSIIRDLVRCLRRLKLSLTLRKKFRCGKFFTIGHSADIRCPFSFTVGDRVGIGKDLYVECDILAGNDILISSNVSFIGNDHRFDDSSKTVYTQGRYPPALIILEGNNLIGFGAIIIGPCTIKHGAIVAAGAVVKGTVHSDMVYGGVPARPIKARYKDSI